MSTNSVAMNEIGFSILVIEWCFFHITNGLHILLDDPNNTNVTTNLVSDSLRSPMKQKVLDDLRTYNEREDGGHVDGGRERS